MREDTSIERTVHNVLMTAGTQQRSENCFLLYDSSFSVYNVLY